MAFSSSNSSLDAGKFIQDELIARSALIHKLPQFCEGITLASGMGKTAYMTKYNRTNVVVDKLSEGVTPTETTMSMTQQSVQVDQWGLYISLTDVVTVTTKHPVLKEALALVADAIARMQDFNIAEVLNAGTNTQFWDGSRATRNAITSTDYVAAAVLNKARADLNDAGAPPRDGDLFIAIVGPQVEADILSESASVGSFSAAHQNAGNTKLEMGVVGDWLGFRWVRSNFMPKFVLISGGSIASIAKTTGGSIGAVTLKWKVTRKSLTRGFEEAFSDEQSTAFNGTTETRAAFTMPSTSGYVYNIYAGTTGDANLFLAQENIPASQVVNVDAVPTSGTNPGTTPTSGVTVHPIYMFAKRAVDNVELNGMSLMGTITPPGPSDSDPLVQRRKLGSKYMSKAGIRDQTRIKRVEVASRF